ncbi:MAG: hypothetical protein J6P16_00015 [Eubacterium sp.]|nr:hypothetical protein [Eubacterium sp.]
MSTLYLHVGTPKTGTSAIQAFMAIPENQAVLESHGISYPLFKNKYNMTNDDAVQQRNAHFLIYGAYLSQNKYHEFGSLRDNIYSEIKALLDAGKNVVLSDESLWHVSLKIDDFYKNIYERITSYGHELKIIVYLRRQDDFIQSYWRYKVMIPRRHLQLSFNQYIKSKKYQYFPLDYHAQLTHIAESTGGKDSIIARAYERRQYAGDPPSIIADFFECIGLKLTDEYTEPDIRRNPGIDYICCEVKRRMNSIENLQSDKNLQRYLIEITGENEKQGLYKVDTLFTKASGKEFMSAYNESNAMTARDFFGRSDGILFYDKPVFEEKEITKFSHNDYMNICFRIMEKMKAENERQKEMINDQKSRLPGNSSKKGILKRVFGKLF